ncbi:MAG: VOC family protein [Candidatus Tumulicola sp.]
MNLELDHVIVCCGAGAPEAAALTGAGFVEGSSNVHPGQGTANRRFFFHNAYLELLWVADLDEARREPARRTRLWERWLRRQDGACPFGIALRPLDPEPSDAPPFPTWAYHAPYLPAQVSIGIALATPLAEPEFLYLNFATPPGAKQREPMTHPSGLVRLTGVRIGMPSPTDVRSQAARAASAAGLVSYYPASGYVMELVFDAGTNDRSVDLRPALPLLLRS